MSARISSEDQSARDQIERHEKGTRRETQTGDFCPRVCEGRSTKLKVRRWSVHTAPGRNGACHAPAGSACHAPARGTGVRRMSLSTLDPTDSAWRGPDSIGCFYVFGLETSEFQFGRCKVSLIFAGAVKKKKLTSNRWSKKAGIKSGCNSIPGGPSPRTGAGRLSSPHSTCVECGSKTRRCDCTSRCRVARGHPSDVIPV